MKDNDKDELLSFPRGATIFNGVDENGEPKMFVRLPPGDYTFDVAPDGDRRVTVICVQAKRIA